MIKLFKQQNKGFVLLFTLIVLTVILTITFGVMGNALKQLNFATSASNSNDAFYAASVGAECALFNDKSSSFSFLETGSSGEVECSGTTIPFTASTSNSWSFNLIRLGASSQSCAKVTVIKDFAAIPVTTVIDSRGFNFGDASCNSTASYRTERALLINY